MTVTDLNRSDWEQPTQGFPPADPQPEPNGKRRRRPDPKARLDHERAELKEIDRDLAAAEKRVAELIDDRRITRAWINANEKILGEKITTWGEPRGPRAKKAAGE